MTVDVICYGERTTWSSRDEAMNFYLTGMIMTDGSERERYADIYSELRMGKKVCTDGSRERMRKP